MILVTGAAGFIGSNFVHSWLNDCQEVVISYDSLTYAGNLNNLKSLEKNKNHLFIKGDISDVKKLSKVFFDYKPRAIINFAAESHVQTAQWLSTYSDFRSYQTCLCSRAFPLRCRLHGLRKHGDARYTLRQRMQR